MNYEEQEYQFNKLLFKSVFILPIIIGMVFMYTSIEGLVIRNKLLKYGIHTIGVVKQIENVNDVDGDYMLYYIDFTSKSGEVFHTENNFGIQDSRYRAGDKVDIVYDAEKPESSLLNDNTEVTGLIIFLVTGFVSVVLGLLGMKHFKLSRGVIYE